MRRAVFMAISASALLLAIAGCNTSNNLVGKTWYLTSGTAVQPAFQWNLPQEQVIHYTIVFDSDGSFTAVADCNHVLGMYTTSSPSSITLTPNVVTLSYCGPNTHDKLYLGMLRTATTYTVAATDLKLGLTDGGSLNYTSVAPSSSESPGASASPSASPTATTTATSSPTPSPTEQATASPTEKPTSGASATPKPTSGASATPKPTSGASATPKPTSGASATPKPTEAPTAAPTSTPAPSNGLLGKDWQLTALTIAVPPFQGAVPEAQQPNYTITFGPDATFSAKADCNTLTGGYTTPDATASTGTLTITPGPTTVVACPAGSLSQLYMDALGQAASYAIADNLLTITLVDGGTLQYK